MESSTNKLLYLFEEVKSKIFYLEDALDEINQVKKSLKVTSIDVKAQIRDSISRHLEALRNREIWLLSQVELILHGKEDLLSQKQSELLEIIGGMKKVCQLLDQSTGVEYLEVFEDQLSGLVKSVEKLNLANEENPDIAFTGQNHELLDSIRAFGHVDHSKEDSSTSMLLNEMECTHSYVGNKRKFANDANPIENWLIGGKKYQDLSSPVGSVEKWLTKCKPYSDIESDMEYSDVNDATDDNLVLSQQKNQDQMKKGIHMSYFTEVKMSSSSSWVRQLPKAPELPKTAVSETYTKIASLGNDYWLLYKQEKSKLKNLPSDLGSIHGKEDDTKWWKLSTAGSLPETNTGKAYSALATSSLKQWLKPKKEVKSLCSGEGDCSDCDKWLLNRSVSSLKNDDLESLADSDWLKVKDMDVVSIENLDSLFSGCGKVDKLGVPNQEDRSGIKKYNSMLQSQPNENWLHSSSSQMEVTESNDGMVTLSEYLTSNDYNKWLVAPSGVSQDVCKWLARSSIDRCKNCPETSCSKGLFKQFEEVKSTSSNMWLKN